MAPQADFQQRLKSIETLLGEIDASADPNLRARVQELVQLVMDLHGAGLERLLELIRAPGDGGEILIDKLGRDDLVASLLILYGLHPLDLEARVIRAIAKLSSRLRSHDAEMELVAMEDGVIRVRLQANGHGCGSNRQSLKEQVEDAIYQAAPDLTSLIVEGAEEKSAFVPLEMLQSAPSLANGLKGGL
jgi:Fe-S cluster biogenesis protein NfuA